MSGYSSLMHPVVLHADGLCTFILWYIIVWAIQADLASLLECQPVVINTGLTETVLNAVGDSAIYTQPIPTMLSLRLN